MPGYKGHLVGGIIAYGSMVYLLRFLNPSVYTLAEWLALTLAGSLFPDVDIKSKGQNFFFSLLFLVLIGLALFNRFHLMAVLGCIGMTPLLVRHRGLFHRIWFLVGAPLLLAWLACGWFPRCSREALFLDALFFIIGALSHIWLDLGFKRMFRW